MTPREQRALEQAIEVARAADYEIEGATLIRSCNAALIELPRAGVVARVELLGGEHLSRRIAVVARHFERCGAPTLRLLHADPPVTLWPRLEDGGDLEPRELGRLLRELHDRTRGRLDPELPPHHPFAEIGAHLSTAENDAAWSRADLCSLRARAAELEARWNELAPSDPLGLALIHGDVHWDNVMRTPEGPVLIDLELAGVGPVTWDFVQLGVAVQRYGLAPATFEGFIAGYGADPRTWVGFEILRDIYELLAAVWAAAYRSRGLAFAREAERRVDGLLGRGDATWSWL